MKTLSTHSFGVCLVAAWVINRVPSKGRYMNFSRYDSDIHLRFERAFEWLLENVSEDIRIDFRIRTHWTGNSETLREIFSDIHCSQSVWFYEPHEQKMRIDMSENLALRFRSLYAEYSEYFDRFITYLDVPLEEPLPA